MIRPLSPNRGIGFFAMEKQNLPGYKEENVGRYWNYYVTPSTWQWPEDYKFHSYSLVVDGFSPNLNKSLHVGHLRNLALANAINLPGAKMVSLLGASQGVYQYAIDELKQWFDFIGYRTELYYDVLMPQDQDIVPRFKDEDESSKTFGCELWNGPKGPVIVTRSNGKHTYSFHDISFANTVKPDYYITGAEQKEHFEELGLGDKHLAFGLVLGKDNKKIKSRTGDSPKAIDILNEIQSNLQPTPDPKKLAWNVLSWNLLGVSRTQNVKYEPERWVESDSPGMYISYTYARCMSALKKAKVTENESVNSWLHCTTNKLQELSAQYNIFSAKDIELLGYSEYFDYYFYRSYKNLDPVEMAHYSKDLAKFITTAYNSEKIMGGRPGFQYAMYKATEILGRTMLNLGMFPLEEI